MSLQNRFVDYLFELQDGKVRYLKYLSHRLRK